MLPTWASTQQGTRRNQKHRAQEETEADCFFGSSSNKPAGFWEVRYKTNLPLVFGSFSNKPDGFCRSATKTICLFISTREGVSLLCSTWPVRRFVSTQLICGRLYVPLFCESELNREFLRGFSAKY